MLEADLYTLPKGDETVIGSNGITLSGGQKQRLSMARALYLDSSLLIFDDVLKGLDADTEEQVFRGVFGPGGLLRRRNATAVLCTHSVRHLPQADHIVALGENGCAVEQGTFCSLDSNTGYIQSLGVKLRGVKKARIDDMATEDDDDLRRSKPEFKMVTRTETTSSKNEKARMNGDPTVYRHYLASIGKRFIVVFVVFGLGWGFFYNWGTIWLQYWSNDVSSPYPSHTSSFYIGLYALFQLAYICSLFSCFLICFRRGTAGKIGSLSIALVSVPANPAAVDQVRDLQEVKYPPEDVCGELEDVERLRLVPWEVHRSSGHVSTFHLVSPTQHMKCTVVSPVFVVAGAKIAALTPPPKALA
jgi:hypothetical protein